MNKFWSDIKSKKTDNSITSLKQEGKLITDTKQKASVLDQQFQSVFSEPSTVTTQKFKEQSYMETKQIPRNIPIYRIANWETMKTELDTLYNEMSNKASTCSADNLWIDFKTKLENLVKQCIPFKKLNKKIKTPWISMTQRKEINSIKQ